MSSPNPHHNQMLPIHAPAPILAMGAELKNAPCRLEGNTLTCAPDLGHLSQPDAYRAFLREVERLRTQGTETLAALACDLHGDYAATRHALALAKAYALPITYVQHHHAHAASLLADHRQAGPILAIVCDGTGLGTDGAIWGGEILLASAAEFTRVGHLREFPLVGGDHAARETFRPATALLVDTLGASGFAEFLETPAGLSLYAHVPPQAVALLQQRLTGPAASSLPRTTSMGRLFDAVAFLLGLCLVNETEAQAPIALQQAAEAFSPESCTPLPFGLDDEGETLSLDWRPTIRAILAGRARGDDVGLLARRFHETLSALFAQAAIQEAKKANLSVVGLSGGCFQNRLLRERLEQRLAAAGLCVLTHRHIPAGDGGIAIGQAYVAASQQNASHPS